MILWFVECGGEPTPIDKEHARLRRMGLLAYAAAKRKDIEVHWIVGSFNHTTRKQREINNNPYMINERFFLHIEKNTSYKKSLSPKRIISYLRLASSVKKRMRLLEKPDVIISAFAPIELSTVVAKYALENQVPYIIDIRDIWPESFYDVIPSGLKCIIDPYVFLCKMRIRKSLSGASSIIALNEGFLEYGISFAGRSKQNNDAVFPLSYPRWEVRNYCGKLSYYWDENTIREEDFIILFLGFFGKQQDFEPVFKAAEKLLPIERIKFALCGDGELLNDYKRMAPDNCIFLGYVDQERLRTLLANSKLGLLPVKDFPGFRMNTPNKFAEYLSAGLPILTSVPGVMQEYLETNNCGVCYRDSAQLQQAILHYYSDKGFYKKSSDNARSLYFQHFNSEYEYNKLIDGMIKLTNRY